MRKKLKPTTPWDLTHLDAQRKTICLIHSIQVHQLQELIRSYNLYSIQCSSILKVVLRNIRHSTSHDLILSSPSEIGNVVSCHKCWRPENLKLLHARIVFKHQRLHIIMYIIYLQGITYYIVFYKTVTPELSDIIIYIFITHKTLLFIVIIHLDVSNTLVRVYNTDEYLRLFSDIPILNELSLKN